MRVYQIPASAHPYFSTLFGILKNVPRAAEPTSLGGLQADLGAGPVDTRRRELRCYPLTKRGVNLHHTHPAIQNPALPQGFLQIRALWYMPAGGGIGWHTNENKPGWRAYVIRSESDAGSYFLTRNHALRDTNGYVNLFEVTATGDTWHAVNAVGERWSLGVMLDAELASRLI